MAQRLKKKKKKICLLKQETPEMQIQSLDQEDLLEKEMATHSSILAWEIPDTGAGWATVYGITRVAFD